MNNVTVTSNRVEQGGGTRVVGNFLAQKSVDRSEERQSLLRDITPDQGRTRENKEPSSHGHIPL